MPMVPMPSPRGTNRERLFISSQLYSNQHGLAFDAKLPRPGGSMRARDQADPDVLRRVAAFIEQKLGPSDLDALLKLIDPNSTDEGATDQEAPDAEFVAKVLEHLTGRLDAQTINAVTEALELPPLDTRHELTEEPPMAGDASIQRLDRLLNSPHIRGEAQPRRVRAQDDAKAFDARLRRKGINVDAVPTFGIKSFDTLFPSAKRIGVV